MLQNAWWHETLRLYAAQGDASALLRACLALDTVPALLLASECLEEAQRLDPALRAEAERHLVADLESTDEARRRIAAEVRFAQRLRAFQRIDDDREIDPGYVTCAEYQLFLDEKRGDDIWLQPDHWVSERFPEGWAQEPATGVRGEDADAFAEWFTLRQGGDAVYRLPSFDEAEHHPVLGAPLMASWCSGEGQWCLVGLTEEQERSLREGMQQLSTLPLPLSILRTPDFARARVRTLLDLDLNLDLDLDLDRARDLGRALARDFAPTLALDLALDLALALIHDIELDCDRNRSFARERALIRSRSLAFDLARARDRNLERARERALDLARALDLSQSPAVVHAKAVVTALDVALAIERGDPSRASEFLRDMGYASLNPQPVSASLLSDFLERLTASTPLARRRTFYCHAARLAEHVWKERRQLASWKSQPWYRRWFSRSTLGEQRSDNVGHDILVLCWWAHLTMARLDEKVPVWEGIRLVRERRTPAE